MLNFIYDEPSTLLGLLTSLGMLLLFCLKYVHRELALPEDIFITTLGLVYSVILIIHGWRLDPILLFSQVILTIILFYGGWTNIRLRALNYVLTKQNELGVKTPWNE